MASDGQVQMVQSSLNDSETGMDGVAVELAKGTNTSVQLPDINVSVNAKELKAGDLFAIGQQASKYQAKQPMKSALMEKTADLKLQTAQKTSQKIGS